MSTVYRRIGGVWRDYVGATPTVPTGVSIMLYGATGNGVTDDAPALRAALAANLSVYIPAGNYRLGSFQSPRQTRLSADFIASLRAGQTITADSGATLTFAANIIVNGPTAWGGNLFMVDGVDNVTISGGVWDFNGQNNTCGAGQTITGYGVYTYGANHTLVQNLTMKNTPGMNYIVMQNIGDDFQVRGCTFRNGGTSLANNHNQIDYSAMYFTGTNYVVDNCHMTHDIEPWFYAGGVEMHGSSGSVTNNIIEKSWPAVYIGPDTTSGLALMSNTTITGNQMLACGRGVVFNAIGTGAIDGVNFSGNTVRLASLPALGASRGIDQDTPDNGAPAWDYHHIITNLVVSNNDFYDDDGLSDFVLRLSQIQSGTISGNRLYNVASQVLQLGSNPYGGTKNVTFSGNTVTWLGASGAPAVTLVPGSYVFDNIHLTSNTITESPASGSSLAVYLDGPTATNVFVTSNTLVGVGAAVGGPNGSRITYTP